VGGSNGLVGGLETGEGSGRSGLLFWKGLCRSLGVWWGSGRGPADSRMGGRCRSGR